MLTAATGSVLWERAFHDTGALFFVKWDAKDSTLYTAATTTYGGAVPGAKDHAHCPATCSVVMRLASSNGAPKWVRTLQGSLRAVGQL